MENAQARPGSWLSCRCLAPRLARIAELGPGAPDGLADLRGGPVIPGADVVEVYSFPSGAASAEP